MSPRHALHRPVPPWLGGGTTAAVLALLLALTLPEVEAAKATAAAPPPLPAPTAQTILTWPEPSRIISAGRAIVGRDIPAGMWSTQGGPRCWWSRDPGTSWETSGTTDAVTISLSAGAVFETYDCTPWEPQ